MVIASLKDGLGGILRLIKGDLRLQLVLLGKQIEEKRKGKVKRETEMVGGGSKEQRIVVLTLFRVALPQ